MNCAWVAKKKYKYTRYQDKPKHLRLGCYGIQLMKTGNGEGIPLCCGKERETHFSKYYH